MAELTQAQQSALALDKNISVTAGAGSGKTRILVERFLAIVSETPNLTRHTVAITFTEKAAGEMQERIVLEINERIRNAETNVQRANYLRIRDQIGSAYITTIHGFCSRILHEYPIESGSPTDFSMLDDIRQTIVMNQALMQVFAQIDQELTDVPRDKLLSLFRHIPRKKVEDILKRALEAPFEMDQIQSTFNEMDGPAYLQFIEKLYKDAFDAIVPQNAMEELYRQINTIFAVDTVNEKNETALEVQRILSAYNAAYSSEPGSLSCQGAFFDVARCLVTDKGKAYKHLGQLGSAKSWSPICKNSFIALSEFCSGFYPALAESVPQTFPDETDILWFADFQTLLILYRRTLEIYRQGKNDEGVLDFEDLQLKTRRLLIDKPLVRQKLSLRFRYIMVDEFQDTNPVQWDIVRLLATADNGEMVPDKVFVVGDPKQAIYGFRNADIRVFKKVKEMFGHLTPEANITFEESFRFVPRLNMFINTIFGEILHENRSNPFEVGFDSLKAMRVINAPCTIDITEFDGDTPEHDEFEYLALKIRELLESDATCHVFDPAQGEETPRPLQPGNIAILLRSRTPLEVIESALRRQNIPFKTVGGVGFWKQPETYAVYHLLRFLSNPQDDLALIGLLRSRFFVLADDTLFLLKDEQGSDYLQKINSALIQPYRESERVRLQQISHMLDAWLSLRERISLGELLGKVIEDTHIEAVLGAEYGALQRLGNLRKLIKLAASFELSNSGGMRSFFAMVDDLVKREVREGQAVIDLDDDSTVKIMTIHASKGLQFPVVFLPALNQKPQNIKDTALIDGEYGLAISQKKGKKNLESNTLFSLLKIRAEQKETAELKRLFYVGVSRASDHLYLCATTKQGKPEPKSMFGLLNSVPTSRVLYDLVTMGNPDVYAVDTVETQQAPIPEMIDFLLTYDGALTSNREILQRLPRPVAGRTFSATALMEFIKNPDQYYERYHLGFFRDDYISFETRTPEPENLALIKGAMLHRYLELLPRFNDHGALIERILFEYEIFDPQTQVLIRGDIQRLSNLLESSATGQRIFLAPNFRNENAVTCKFGEDYLTGKFDRLQQTNDGKWEVIDYKTNNIPVSAVEQTFKNYEIQIKMYAVLLAALYPQQDTYDVSLYFLNIDQLKTRRFALDDIQRIRNDFAAVIDSIKSSFPIE